jgi:hypothetical protein
VANTGNVKLRGLELLAPAFAGSSSDNTITCTHSDDGSAWNDPDLAASSSLSCSDSFSFSQDAIEAGDISPAVTATAANLAAAVTVDLPPISVPNTPALSITIDAVSCAPPSNAGKGARMVDSACSGVLSVITTPA